MRRINQMAIYKLSVDIDIHADNLEAARQHLKRVLAGITWDENDLPEREADRQSDANPLGSLNVARSADTRDANDMVGTLIPVVLPPSPLGLFEEGSDARPPYPYAAGSDDEVQVYLGPIDGHHAIVIAWQVVPDKYMVQLQWGCRRIDSEDEARCHWRRLATTSGHEITSVVSHEPRPSAIKLIDWVCELCRLNQWEWR